ncbi:M15 family metallopeptidase [Candidatus Phyllobacterium onerii]|uniref:M15 family metallopeptidase n=1 Tax=Candidatus Phyllobacterium onerii TaxID=3020828 RepID=UPI00232FDF12|nr:M15 family metallopeptidase [Phyllobacterium sp. IY22]
MSIASYNHPLFGLVTFKTKHSGWVRGDDITFASGFDINQIQVVHIPQLEKIPGTHGGNLKFHQRAHAQVLAAFAEIERLGLMHHIKTCAGSLNFRLKKPTSGRLSKEPSNHAFGIAIDLNADDGSLGASVAPVAPVFESLGFRWGKAFSDPMHFEIKTFVDHPKALSSPVAVTIDGKKSALEAKNLFGDVVAKLSDLEKLFDLDVTSASESSVIVQGKTGTALTELRQFGDQVYASLLPLAGVGGFHSHFDNVSKVLHLTKA